MKNMAVVYARFSSHGQNEQSIEAQVRICKEFAESRGLKVINIYPDKARTGTNDARPSFQKMIADAESGAFKYIIVYMFDRFARNRRDSIMYKEMLKEKYGIRVLSALEPIAEDEGGEFYEMFLEWNAEKYSKRLSKRVKDGLDISVANGTFCGGYLIYGYKIELEPIPGRINKFIKHIVVDEEAAYSIRYAFEQYYKGVTKKEIADALNKQGCRYKGKPFKSKILDKWFINPKYTGEFHFGGRLSTNMYPPIIEKELFLGVQKRLQENKYFAGGMATAKEPYLLTGKLFCGDCGTDMVSDGGTGKAGTKYYYYACKQMKKRQCHKRREHKDALELYVTSCVVDFLKDPANAEIATEDVLKYYERKTNIDSMKSITTKITKAQKEVEELAAAFIKAKSALLQDTIETKMQEYEILLNDLETQKAQLELERGYQVTKEELVNFIADLIKGDVNDKTYQKNIIDHLVSQVFVGDDDTVVYFNIRGGKGIETISFEETKKALEGASGVQSHSPPLRQAKRTPVGVLFACVSAIKKIFFRFLGMDLYQRKSDADWLRQSVLLCLAA